MKPVKELKAKLAPGLVLDPERLPVRLDVRSGNRWHKLDVTAVYDYEQAEVRAVEMVDGRRFAELDEDGRGAFGLGHFSVEEVYRAVAAALV